MKNSKLHGKVVVITGGSSGIGGAAAKYLFDKGANVVKADIMINKESLSEVTEGAYTKRLMEIHLDVRSIDSWNKLFNSVIKEFGKANVLINCAGIIVPGSLIQQGKSMIEDQIAINLLGPIIGSKVFLPLFKELNEGHIINISSLAGITPIPFESIYSASKFGLRGFSLALAYELKYSGVKVSVICPDAVVTSQLLGEANYDKANLSFTGKLFDKEYIAEKIYRTILHPQKEVLITPLRGLLCKLGGNSTTFMSTLLPLFNMIGERKRKKFLHKIENKESYKW